MIHFTLSVENLPSACRATGDDIRRAIESLRSPTGPTYINPVSYTHLTLPTIYSV